ncbi:hypothetical protein M9979_05065 [Sphingomonas sp. RP10(2022)]|uniref:DUF3592 domain-containing protein n=1 Tax=Sphingomonas liriopis TaxID=2949094 RepID=A0A9X2KQ54_9SPHN|nr:DUF3592 domain-containing protein [Sphingomonas liriopis]MCP3734246.1 hypothetical protein [Sphingomonas liriopis]
MNRNHKIVIGLLVVGAVFVAVMGYLASVRRAKQTAQATATVVATATAAKRGADDTIVILAYRAGTVPAQGRARISGVHTSEFPAGRQVAICYDPADTRSLRIAKGPCG